MPATTYKAIPAHADWKKNRDAAGGKSNMCGKVNIGKLLDEYAKVKTKKKERLAALEKLQLGMRTYIAEPKVKAIKDLLATCNSLLKAADSEILAMKMDKDVGLAVAHSVMDGMGRLDKIVAELKAKKLTDARMSYERFYDGIGRGLGKILPAGEIRKYWQTAYESIPSREDVSRAKDDAAAELMVASSVKQYRVALKKVIEMSEQAGYELKL